MFEEAVGEPDPVADSLDPAALADGWCVPGVTPSRPAEPAVEVPAPVLLALRAAVDAAVHAVHEVGPSGRACDVHEVLVLAERLRGLALVELGELDASRDYVAAGSVSAAAWLRRTLTIGEDSARATVRLAGRLRQDLTTLQDDLTAGRTTLEHVRAAAAGTAGLDPDLVASVGPALSALTQSVEPAVVRRELRRRAESIDPRLAEDAARRQHARRGLWVSQLPGTGVLLDGQLPDEDGAILLHSLDLAVEASRADGDTRSVPARRADVLLDWARQALHTLTGPGDSLAQDTHTVRSHLLITCTPDQLAQMSRQDSQQTLLGLLDAPQRDASGRLTGPDALDVLTGTTPTRPASLPTGAPLLPAALRRLACDATVTLTALRDTAPARRPPARVVCPPRSTRSTSAGPPAPSAGSSSKPSSSATAPASSRAATPDPPSAPDTTSSTGSTAEPPTSTTSSCSATATTTTTTTAATTSPTTTDAGSPRPAGPTAHDRSDVRGVRDPEVRQ